MTLQKESQASGDHIDHRDNEDDIDSDANVFIGEHPEVRHQDGDFWEGRCRDVKIQFRCGPLGSW